MPAIVFGSVLVFLVFGLVRMAFFPPGIDDCDSEPRVLAMGTVPVMPLATECVAPPIEFDGVLYEQEPATVHPTRLGSAHSIDDPEGEYRFVREVRGLGAERMIVLTADITVPPIAYGDGRRDRRNAFGRRRAPRADACTHSLPPVIE